MEYVGKAASGPTIIPRSEHVVSRANISENAIKVLYRLKNAGYAAHLVGGGVRDLLLGREPKDFDIVTDALPDEVRKLFRNCRLIGRRFRLAHIHFGREIIEVATFRARIDAEGDGDMHMENGRIIRDNVYGGHEEDAWRRDFTVNALYYDINDFSVVDFVGGYDDLREGVLRLIGDPEQRYREDPVRMLRAVRFAVKLGFRIHVDSEAPLWGLGPLLQDIPPARLFEEVLKMFQGGYALQTFEMLRHYRLFGELFPQTEAALAREEHGFPLTLLTRALDNTDQRVAQDKPVTPAFLFAALLWEPMRLKAESYYLAGLPALQAIQAAADEVLEEQRARIVIPRRFSLPLKEIWMLQVRLSNRSGRRPLRLLDHPRFRAGYDFLLLRAEVGEEDPALAEWWTRFQEVEDAERASMLEPAPKRRRGRRRKHKDADEPRESAGAGDTDA